VDGSPNEIGKITEAIDLVVQYKGLGKDTGQPPGATSPTHTHTPRGSYPWHGLDGLDGLDGSMFEE